MKNTFPLRRPHNGAAGIRLCPLPPRNPPPHPEPGCPGLRHRTLPHPAGTRGRLGAGIASALCRIRTPPRRGCRLHPPARHQAPEAGSRRKTVTATSVDLRAPVRDTVVLLRRDTLRIRDTLKLFRWRDAWVTVEGRIRTDSVACRVESTDTLRQVVHRVPRRFLFIRWGTKALRQEIVSSNPHTRIVYSDYVKFER